MNTEFGVIATLLPWTRSCVCAQQSHARRGQQSSNIEAYLVQFEVAGRREAAVLISACHPHHSAFGLQPQTLQGISFQWGEVDLEANWCLDGWGRGTDYKRSQDADIACAADVLSVLS